MSKKNVLWSRMERPTEVARYQHLELKGKDENYFSCKLCGGSSYRLGNMTMGVLWKHMTNSKHQKNVAANVKSQVKMSFTANKVSEIVVLQILPSHQI